MSATLSLTLGVLASVPYLSPIVTSCFVLPFKNYIDIKFYFLVHGFCQGAWLIKYYVNKRDKYDEQMKLFSRQTNTKSASNFVFTEGSGALFFNVLVLPWRLLENMSMVQKPKSYIKATILRGFGKLFLFGTSLGIVYLYDHITMKWV